MRRRAAGRCQLGQGGPRPRYSGLIAQTFRATHDFFVTEW